MKTLLKLGVVIAAVAALGVGATPATADPNERGQGAPGRECKGEQPGTEAFRQCVQGLAHQRGQGNGPGATGLRRRGLVRAARQACRQNHQPGTAEFRQCVRQTVQANRAARRAAIQECRQQFERGTQQRRDCLRAAKQIGL
jgi:hypothetical protein